VLKKPLGIEGGVTVEHFLALSQTAKESAAGLVLAVTAITVPNKYRIQYNTIQKGGTLTIGTRKMVRGLETEMGGVLPGEGIGVVAWQAAANCVKKQEVLGIALD